LSAHLLAVAVGPVQSFISAARRTRDLWFGSYLLSEISKAVARSITECGGELIFPAPQDQSDLERESGFTVANRVLAKLPEGSDPEGVKDSAKTKALECWRGYAKNARKEAGDLVNPAIWEEQLKDDDVIEFFAAWVPLLSDKDYPNARSNVMRLLTGRKACRDFKQVAGHAKVPKSSLDGARETVLVCGNTRGETRDLRYKYLVDHKGLAQRLRLRVGEELDIVGLTKRAATKETFASVVRVAADPWIRGILKDNGPALRELRDIEAKCKIAAFATGTGLCYTDIFPFDGSVLFPSRLQRMIAATKREGRDYDEYDFLLSPDDRGTLEDIDGILKKIIHGVKDEYSGYGEPDPYLAVLVADGDQMGKTISSIETRERHGEFSAKLATFTKNVRGIVSIHNGCFVYSGGDDVLSFVPVNTCLRCAKELHDRFSELLKEYGPESNPPTLSVGIAIGHFMEPLEDLLQYARDAERAAKKPDRNGLAIHVHARGGVPIRIRGRWDNGICHRLDEWIKMYRKDKIPGTVAFDMKEMAKDYAGWPITDETKKVIEQDIERLLKKKRPRDKELEVKPLLADLEPYLSHEVADLPEEKELPYHSGLMRLANEWLIARRIAEVMDQAREDLPK
jgi:CRISPR-associated protein Cmr2